MQPRKTTDTQSTSSRPAPFGQSQQDNGNSYGGRRPSQQEIAKRAYEIYKSGKGGSEVENWFRAERELRAA
jgi:hypothetical protein